MKEDAGLGGAMGDRKGAKAGNRLGMKERWKGNEHKGG